MKRKIIALTLVFALVFQSAPGVWADELIIEEMEPDAVEEASADMAEAWDSGITLELADDLSENEPSEQTENTADSEASDWEKSEIDGTILSDAGEAFEDAYDSSVPDIQESETDLEDAAYVRENRDGLIEDIETVELTDAGTENESEEIQDETVILTLQESGYAADAYREAGTYYAGDFPGDYGGQLSSLAKIFYNNMVAAYVTQRGSGAFSVPVGDSYTFDTGSSTLKSGSVVWDSDTNAQYQEVIAEIMYAAQSAYDAMIYDYPEVFWLGSLDISITSSFAKSSSSGTYAGKISAIAFNPYESYSGAAGDIAAFDSAVSKAVASIRGSLPANATSYDTAKAIHDYICKKVDYNESKYSHTAASVFLYSSSGAVCEGYAKAFKILSGKFGIDSILIVGYAGGDHMWNYVRMDNGNWYLVDATWDDQQSGILYTYFLAGGGTYSYFYPDLYIREERWIYTNFSGSEYSVNFSVPVLSSNAYTGDTHTHTWVATTVVEPTCTSSGFYFYKCSCGAETYELIDAIGHSYQNKTYVYNNDATCLADGTKSLVCDNGCGTVLYTVTAEGTKLKAKLTVNARKLTLKKGQATTAFKVTMAKGDYVTKWKSSKTSVVRVSGNKDGTCTITAKKTGTAKITIRLKSGLTKVIKVTVKSGKVKTTKITGVVTALTIKAGETYKLSPKITPITSTQKLRYSSSKPKVAKVSSGGKITALKKGKTVITIKSGSVSVKCTVTVKQ